MGFGEKWPYIIVLFVRPCILEIKNSTSNQQRTINGGIFVINTNLLARFHREDQTNFQTNLRLFSL